MFQSEWQNKKVAFLGDSITDKLRDYKTYWELLEENPGIKALGYGVNGQRWEHVISQAKRLLADHGTDVDAIFIFMGTNDYGHETPLGSVEDTQDGTFYGALNEIVPALAAKHTSSKIVFVTPLHRYGFGTSKILGTEFTKVVITGIGEYGGSRIVSFTILPKWMKWFI